MTNNKHSKGEWTDRSLLDPAQVQALDTAGIARFITRKLDQTLAGDVSEVRMTFKRIDGKLPEGWPGTLGPSHRNGRKRRGRRQDFEIAVLVDEFSP